MPKIFTSIAVGVFGLVALAHVHRLVFGWEVMAAGWFVPRWLSALAGLFAAVLAVMLWRESRK